MRFRSLKALTLAFLALFLTATVLTGLTLYVANTAAIVRLVDKRIATVSTLVAPPDVATSRAEIESRIALFSRERDTGDIGFLLTDADGRRLAGNVAVARRLPAGYADLGVHDAIVGLSRGRAYTRAVGGGLFLTTIAETEPFDRYREERRRAYLIGFGSIIVIVVAGLLAFGRIVRVRILAMRRTVDAIIDGDMRRRVPVDHSGSEFDSQAIAFNRMLDRIEGLMQGLGTISNEIAHDLRTPLARLRAQLMQIAEDPDARAVRPSVEAALAQGDAILAMFEAMLRIVEIEGGARRAGFAPLDPAALAAEVVATMQPVAEEKEQRLEVANVAAAAMTGDRQLLSQALLNLIDNAIRYSPAGSAIRVEVMAEGEGIAIAVADNGPGIAPDHHARALRRFGRLDAHRGSAGHGLGLPLVEAVVRLHGGTLDLADARPGLRVTLHFPGHPPSPTAQ